MGIDQSQDVKDIESGLSSLKTTIDVLKSEKDLKKSLGSSISKSDNNLSTQLDSISAQQKRYQRDPPSSMDNLLNFLGVTSGTGTQTTKYLRKKLLEVSVKIEPDIQKIISNQAISALGCSQEQTYIGISASDLELQPLPTQPISQGIYIPVSSLDFFSNLKNSPDSKVGQVYYENPNPSVDMKFSPYGGNISYPMNKQLYQLLQNPSTSFATQFGKNYQGKSGQNLFDIQYSKTNEYGISGDYYRVALINRDGSNNIGTFLNDYYHTIKMIDPVDIGSQLVNILSGAINIQTQMGVSDVADQSKFYLIVQRILGLCFDSRTEIDVSGISKIAELDGVDDTFFEFTEVDLRNIDLRTTNTQNGVMEFEDCDNVKLPVNSDVLVSQLINFRQSQSGQTTEQKVAVLEQIIDSISQNPAWKLAVPTNFNVDVAINKNILKQIPLAVAAGVLTPKVLLPIFTLIQVVESQSKNTYTQAITSTNTITDQNNNIANNSVDFIKKYKKFVIEVVSLIGAIYLKTLFDLLKKDIINLLGSIIGDINKTKMLKKYAMILRLVQLALVISQLISDYRRCKSLLSDILLLLNLINGVGSGKNDIPLPLLLLTKFLPGTSPERSTINTIQSLQSLGIPTGALPDGSPNLMLLYNLATHRGADKENAENGKIDAIGLVPPITGGLVQIFGKAH